MVINTHDRAKNRVVTTRHKVVVKGYDDCSASKLAASPFESVSFDIVEYISNPMGIFLYVLHVADFVHFLSFPDCIKSGSLFLLTRDLGGTMRKLTNSCIT